VEPLDQDSENEVARTDDAEHPSTVKTAVTAGTGWTRPFRSPEHGRNGRVDPSRGAQRPSFATAVPFGGRVGALRVLHIRETGTSF
jgi:hypothetical protein